MDTVTIIGIAISGVSSCFTLIVIPGGAGIWWYISQKHLPERDARQRAIVDADLEAKAELRHNRLGQENVVIETLREIMREAIGASGSEMDAMAIKIATLASEVERLRNAITILTGAIERNIRDKGAE